MSKVLPEALRAIRREGERSFLRPAISGRKAALLRKKAQLNGKYYVGAKLEEGGWDPCWERRLATVIKAPKGKAFERKRPDRVKKIEANMKDMNKRIEEMRANRVKGKPKTWLEKFLRKEGLWDEKFKG
mmetsp:Transcript_6565/g.10350  ORF Transcript_6565/g.10350 Transcript_6565/m.10350 type:complete len:129 (-) Transcript_6565:32-418(-)